MSAIRVKRPPMAQGGVVVKSAGRVLRILEYFDSIQCAANVVEVSTALGYPQSSTSLLLRSLVTLGYLHYNSQRRTYTPTSRVPLLGNWVGRDLFRDGRLYRLFEQVQRETGCLVVLTARNECYVQYIYMSRAQGEKSRAVDSGSLHPLTASACGRAILGAIPDVEAGKIVRRLNANAKAPELVMKAPIFARELAMIKARGYVCGAHPAATELGEIAVPITIDAMGAHAIGLVGPAEHLFGNTDAFVRALRSAISAHLNTERSEFPDKFGDRAPTPSGAAASAFGELVYCALGSKLSGSDAALDDRLVR